MNTGLCKNCESPLSGSYCHECGQSIRGSDRFFFTLVNEAFEDIFSLNSRAWKTVSGLFFRPGFLSTEYFAGRRVRYIPPVRLYFTASILFFVVFSVASFFNEDIGGVEVTAGQTQEVVLDEEADQKPEVEEEVKPEADVQPEGDEAVTEDGEKGFTLFNGDPAKLGLTQEQMDRLEKRIEIQIEKAKELYTRDPGFLQDYILEVAPPIIFCLLPLFALLLKIVYVFKGMFYTQHLVLAVHNHCFIFLWLTINTLFTLATGSWGWIHSIAEFFLLAWVPLYLWRSLRVVYQQGVIMTTIKFLVLVTAYGFLIGFAAIGAILFGLLTL